MLNIFPLVAGTPRKISGPRARDLMGLLEMQLVLVSGGRDKRGGPTITFPASSISREKARPEEYSKLLHYLTLVPRFALNVSCFLRQWAQSPWSSSKGPPGAKVTALKALLCPHHLKHKVSPDGKRNKNVDGNMSHFVSDGGEDEKY